MLQKEVSSAAPSDLSQLFESCESGYCCRLDAHLTSVDERSL